jgi:hypothetical protein
MKFLYAIPMSKVANKLFDFFKIVVCRVVAPCSLVEVYRRFRGPCCLHHLGGYH